MKEHNRNLLIKCKKSGKLLKKKTSPIDLKINVTEDLRKYLTKN